MAVVLEVGGGGEQGDTGDLDALDVKVEGYTDKRRSPVIFYSDPPMALIAHANAITKEDVPGPGEQTRARWGRAGRAWEKFGDVDIPTTFGHTIRLNGLTQLREELKELRDKLEALSPNSREIVREQRHAALTPEERAIFDAKKSPNEMSEEEMAAYGRAFRKLSVSDMDVAEAMPKDLRAKALSIARQASETTAIADHTSSYSDIVNYQYWKTRCEVESSKTTTDARRFMLHADKRGEMGDPEGAKMQYNQAWDEWVKIFEQYPQLVDDDMAEDLKEVVLRYKLVLDQLDEEFPTDFKLQMLDRRGRDEGEPGAMPGQSGGRQQGLPEGVSETVTGAIAT